MVNEKVLITKTTASTSELKMPKAYIDAIESPKGALWKEAMDYELNKLEEMDTWSKIKRMDVLAGEQIISGMWVHIVKNLESGGRNFHSRWMVQGNQQKTNLSLSDTFAPISCISSLWILLGLTALKDLHIFTWDIDWAYIHGKIDHDIYISFLEGYGKPG